MTDRAWETRVLLQPREQIVKRGTQKGLRYVVVCNRKNHWQVWESGSEQCLSDCTCRPDLKQKGKK